MRGFWRELEVFLPAGSHIAADVIFWDMRRMYEFLMALRPEFGPLVGQLIHRDPPPSLETAVAELVVEETRLRLLGGVKSTPAPSSFSGVLAAAPSSVSTAPSGRPTCPHCMRPGHTIDDCWKLHPERRVGPRGRGRRASTSTVAAVTHALPSPAPAPAPALALPQIDIQQFQQFQQYQQRLEQMTTSSSTGSVYQPGDWQWS
ncbi:uncharacterized protein LOC120005810 isoform X2 [Tripterygium wilfordii]|uniref:uncharacterized protein LOC120005810 isoform X2 n=1 Tax=Tripterygium wilfordii TaxID=458696 RepID=UPI0018F80273|nr:uncharacterized protein LOC120005810 isoform X2 [Tripterygium wilfordii]